MYFVSKQSTLKTITTHLWLDLLRAEIHRDIINAEEKSDYIGATLSHILVEDSDNKVEINPINIYFDDCTEQTDDSIMFILDISDDIILNAEIVYWHKWNGNTESFDYEIKGVNFMYNNSDFDIKNSKPIVFSAGTQKTLVDYVLNFEDTENFIYNFFQTYRPDLSTCNCMHDCRC